MKVSLVSITKPVSEELDHLSPEELIVYIARVSSPNNQLKTETAPKLIKYCIDHKHWSVFESVYVTYEIETSRAIAQQILRHRSFTFQEFSQRYAEASLGFETYHARAQGQTNRQSSTDTLSQEVKDWFEGAQQAIEKECRDYYYTALDKGIAKEQARFLLPLSTTTRLYMTGSVRSWIHYFDARCDGHAQQEHQTIAFAIRDSMKDLFPNISEALGW